MATSRGVKTLALRLATILNFASLLLMEHALNNYSFQRLLTYFRFPEPKRKLSDSTTGLAGIMTT